MKSESKRDSHTDQGSADFEKVSAGRPLRPARLADVAREAKVSIGVASQVLNQTKGNSRASKEKAERIQAVAASLNYRPHAGALHLRGKRTYTYGIMVASAGDPLRSFLVQDLDVESVKIGRRTVICNTVGNPQEGQDRFDEEMEALLHRGVDGIFCAVHRWWPGDREKLLKMHPYTVFYDDPGIPEAAFVAPDRKAAVGIAVRHLAARGCRRIAIAVENLNRFGGQERLDGYKDALKSLNIPFETELVFDGGVDDWVCGCYDNASGTWIFPNDLAQQAIDRLVLDGRADAIVAHNDYWGSVLIRLLRARGLTVPSDVAITGYLNHYLADWTDPPLTSISLRNDIAARAMVTILEKMILKKAVPKAERQVYIKPRLIVRGSA